MRNRRMSNGTYGGVGGRKTKVRLCQNWRSPTSLFEFKTVLIFFVVIGLFYLFGCYFHFIQSIPRIYYVRKNEWD